MVFSDLMTERIVLPAKNCRMGDQVSKENWRRAGGRLTMAIKLNIIPTPSMTANQPRPSISTSPSHFQYPQTIATPSRPNGPIPNSQLQLQSSHLRLISPEGERAKDQT